MTGHEELQELLGAYALDAVDGDELVALETHLAECPRCRAEVTELREVAALLGQSGSDAPEGVWERIVASLSDVPPPLRLEVQRERRATRVRSRLLGAAVASAAAAIVAVLAISVVNLRSHVDDLEHRGTDTAAAAQQAMTTTGVRIAHLSGRGGLSAAAVVQANGQGYFLASTLPALDHRVYELWGAAQSGQIISLGTMAGPGVYAFTADPSVQTVMVTEEAGPVPAPTSAPLATGTLA